MSVAVVARASRERVRTIERADVIAAAAAAVVTGALAVLTWGTWGDLDSDTGYEIAAAMRMLDGELPYRDFTYFYGPLAPALGWITAATFGAGVWSAVGLGFVVTLAILATTFVLARLISGAVGAVLATSITAAVAFIPDNYNYVLPHTTAATAGMLGVLLLLLAIWRATDAPTKSRLATVGLCVGAVCLTKPEFVLAAVATAAVWLATSRRSTMLRDIGIVAGAALAVPALVYSALLAAVPFRTLVFENLYPVDVLDAGGDVELAGRMPLTASSFVELGAKLFLYALGCVALLAAAGALARGGTLRRAAIVVLAAAATAAAGAAVLNPEALRHGLEYTYGWIPAAAVIATCAVVVRRLRSQRPAPPLEQLELAGLAALAVVAATNYPGFFPHAPHEQMAAYYIPLAAIFVTRLHLRELAPTRPAYVIGGAWLAFLAAAGLGLTLKDARLESATVTGAAGSLAEAPREAALYQGVLGWLEREAEPGEQIFAAPMLTGLYALSDRTSPVRELAMLPGALPSQEDEVRAIRSLDAAGVRIVITDDRSWPGYGHTQFGDSFDRALAHWLAAEFEPAASFRAGESVSFEGAQSRRTLTIWTRRTQ